jgi:hypothetical protein
LASEAKGRGFESRRARQSLTAILFDGRKGKGGMVRSFNPGIGIDQIAESGLVLQANWGGSVSSDDSSLSRVVRVRIRIAFSAAAAYKPAPQRYCHATPKASKSLPVRVEVPVLA